MLVRQATLTYQKALSSFAARAAAVGVNLRGHHGTGACSHQTPKILITGGLGQLGMPLARVFRSKYGQDSVILTDIKKPDPAVKDVGHFEFADIMDVDGLRELVVEHRIDWLIHFSALLSAVGEQNTPLAMQVNIGGLHNIFNVAREFSLRLFIPSTIGAFGPNSPRNPTPDDCIQQPNTIYGVSKVHAELLGMYLNHRYGLDFRSLRLPGVISADVEPGGGTTDYAIHIFKYAMRGEPYPCFLSQNTRLPMIWIDDVIRAMAEVMECPREKLKRCVYNLAGISFTPKEINEAMLRGMHRHGLIEQLKTYELKYDVDFRQKIADSWPEVLDDANARRDWGWRHEVDIDGMVDKMFEYLKAHSTCKKRFSAPHVPRISSIYIFFPMEHCHFSQCI
ncbi:L-threonine 3-dehydrogenase [Echinococcus granulosus]|uniref:L-threonine 3-dehydrogenase, mitochondrial n=1 Tax=Echinococcus granulosus TaxID=6210 RepID=W6U881_ECHGR|nr:L-threonine 3-dehydrogenase [Echinococcus granulosus]EUB57365.1 L-threonine 3-dehydrogenase [Echinococcus granulosus]